MKRREFIAVVGGATVWSFAVRAQQGASMRRMGVLLFAQEDLMVIRPFLEELRTLGYVEGKTLAIEYRDAEENYSRLPQLAAELVRLNPDVLFSFGGELAPFLKNVTAKIPIIVVVSNDPVASGLVSSLGRPGGNITGVTYVNDQLAGKTVELLKEVVPRASRVGVLWNPNHADPEFRETQRAATARDVQLLSLEVREAADFEGAFQAAIRERAEALIVVGSRIIALHRQQIADFAAKNRLILVGGPKYFLEMGGLLTYGPNVVELNRIAAGYVHKIFKGARPADLPMQQPTMFVLAINLRVAKALDLTIPPTLLATADEVIE
jgi:putative ABC transport system substrate-binding protein